MRFLKLLHGRKDNTVCLTTGKEITQILTTLSVHRVLTQEILALCKLSEKLIVQVVSVGQHNNRWAIQGFLKQMGISVNKNNFNQEVLNSDKPVLMDFWAPWCGPCRMVVPLVEEIAKERSDIKVVKINVDEEQELAMQFGVMSIPTLVVMKNGKIVNQVTGARPKAQILAML